MSGSENTPRDTEFDNSIFAEMIAQLQANSDAGVIEYEEAAKEVCEGLFNAYIGYDEDSSTEVVVDDADADSEDDELERELYEARADLGMKWMHEDDVARVSGRLYVNNKYADKLHFPDEWGKMMVDEDLKLNFYLVDNVQLRSTGVDVMPIYNVYGALIDIRATYDFAFTDDDELRDVVYAFAEDLSVHEYESPSPQEAIRYLEAHHAEELALVNKALSADGNLSFPARLGVLLAQLKDKFSESSKFMKCVEQYIQHFTNFNRQSAYKIRIENGLQLFDGSDIVTEADDLAMWPNYSLNRDITIEGYLPLVKLIKSQEGEINCYLQVMRYNSQSGDADPEFVRIDVNSIASFRSNEAERSLRSMLKFDIARLVALDPELFESDVEDEDNGVELRVEKSPVSERDLIPSLISGLEAFESELMLVTEKLNAARQIKYKTPEEAVAAANLFIQQEMRDLFNLYKFGHGYTLIVAGEGTVHPNSTISTEPASETDSRLSNLHYIINPETPFISLELGDKREVALEGAYLAIEEVEEEDLFDSEAYIIKPALSVRPQLYSETLALANNVEFAVANIEERMIVNLDGSAEIMIPVLEGYRDAQASINSLAGDKALIPVVELLKNLQTSIVEALDIGEFVEFDKVELFAMLESFSNDKESTKKITTAFNGLVEALLIQRQIQISGEMLIRDFENGGVVSLTYNGSDALLPGKVMDIRNDIDGNDLFLIIHNELEDDIVAVRMRTITKLMF